MKKIYALLLVVFSSTSMFGQLIINEVLYDPSNDTTAGDANGDGIYDQEEDSFIEFYNTSSTNFDASGYQIWDDTTSGSLRYVVPQGTWVPPHGALVIFGGGTLTGNFGGAVVLKTDSAAGMNLNNSGEVIAIRDANGTTVLTFDSDALSNNPNESYTRNPDITGLFEQHGDNTPILFSPGTMVDGTPFDTIFVVSSIDVQGQGGATSITTLGGTLQMQAMVNPTFADDTTVTWSVSGGSFATINTSGLLTAVSNGVITVKATANDGSGVSDSADITISNQVVGLNEFENEAFSIYPNPASDAIFLNTNAKIDLVRIYTITGQLVKEVAPVDNTVDVGDLKTGDYLLLNVSDQLDSEGVRFSKK